MRILYLVTKADLDGAQMHVLDLLRGLRGMQDAAVGVGEAGFFTDAVRKLGIPHYVLPNLAQPVSPAKDFRAVADVARLIRSIHADIVHAHTWKAGVIGRLAARVVGVPAVFTAHTWCFAEGTSWKWRLAGIPMERIAAHLGGLIINVSDANRDLALRHRIAPERRMLTIRSGIPDTRHRARPDAGRLPEVVMVARCVEQKDHPLLLRVMAKINCPVKAVFVGDGPQLPRLKQEAEQLGVGNRVDFLGKRKDVAQLLSRAHIFALPTKRTLPTNWALPTNWDLPLSILEAMRAGLPVVASNVGGVSEAVVNGETGFLVDPGDEEDFHRRMMDLLDEPRLRRRMGAAGRARYEARFTLRHMLDKTMAIYQMAARCPREQGPVIPAPARALPAASRDPEGAVARTRS